MITLKQKWLLLFLIDCLFFIASLFKPDTIFMTLVLIVWSNGFLFSLDNLERRGALFSFLISFFLILIGREALEIYGLHDIEIGFSEKLNIQAEALLLVSLLSLFLGYFLANGFSIKTVNHKKINYNSVQYLSTQKVSSALFLLTFSFNIFTLMDIVLFVARYGYIAFYTSYASSVPYVIKKIGDMCLVCFWIFLATMPEKKKVDRLSVIYVIYLLLTLGTGKRFPFVAGLLTLFVYYMARNKINNEDKVWITKRTIILLFLLAPLFIILLYAIAQIRVDNVVGSLRIDKIISNFLYDQGVSINIIKRAQLYSSSLPEGKAYLFGSTFEAISNNVIFRIFGATQYSGNTVEHALNGYSFQHAISYAAMGNYYLSGHGLGSCYIAEAFHDLGYFGVVIVNLIYGVIFRKVFDFKAHGIWGTAIILSMLNSLLLAPRGSADGFIADIVDLTTWGTILVVWLFSKALSRRANRMVVEPLRSVK